MNDNKNLDDDNLIGDENLDLVDLQPINNEFTEIRNPWFVRTFSKMEEGSLRASIILMAVSGLGPAVYTYHVVYHKIGIIPTFFMTAVVIAAYLFSIDVWIFTYRKYPQAKSLNQIVRLGGGPLIGKLHSFFFLAVCYLTVISCLLSVNKVLYALIGQYYFNYRDIPQDERSFEKFNQEEIWFLAFLFFLLFMQKDTSFFKKVSFFSVFFTIIVVSVIFMEAPFMYAYLEKENKLDFNWYETTFQNFFITFSIICYDLNVTMNFFLITQTVKNPERRRLNKVFRRSFVTLGFILLLIGLLSYLSLGEFYVEKVDLFINRANIWEPDTLIVFCRVLCFFSFLVSSVLLLFPLKLQILSFLPNPKSQVANIIVSLAICYSASLFGVLIPSLTKMFALAGNVGSITLSILLPSFQALNVNYTRKKEKRLLIWLWIIISLILMLVGLFYILTS